MRLRSQMMLLKSVPRDRRSSARRGWADHDRWWARSLSSKGAWRDLSWQRQKSVTSSDIFAGAFEFASAATNMFTSWTSFLTCWSIFTASNSRSRANCTR